MRITLLGLVIVPLSLFWASNAARLLQLALVAAIFEAAAAVILGGSFGLPPAMVPGLLFIAYLTVQYALGMRYPAEGTALWALTPLLMLFGYAALSVLILPQSFAGMLLVWPQRPDPMQPGFEPLAFSPGNVTQSLYLAINVTMATAAAIFLSRAGIPYRRIMAAYLLGGYIAVFLAFWQFASRVAGVPFLQDVLYSNPSWAIVEQTLGSVPRIQGPFSEPAGLAFYLCGLCFCCTWLIAHGHRIMRVHLLLALGVTAMLLSTSTTGLVTLAIGMPLILLFAILHGGRGAIARLLRVIAAFLIAATVVAAPVLIMRPQLIGSVQEVIDSTLTKEDSDSFSQRTDIDAAALDTLVPTYGLGVGWGSFRASSLVPGLLANSGLFGVAMVLWLVVRVIAVVRRAGGYGARHPGRSVVDGFSAALVGQVAAALISAPTIGTPAFYLQLGCVVGVAARMSLERHAPLPRPAGRAPLDPVSLAGGAEAAP